MKTIVNIISYRAFALFAFACFALSPTAKALLPPPAPDGGYPNGNTAEGFNALFNLRSGIQNTATGFRALYSDTTGENDTAVGNRALQTNTSGTANTAIGVVALQANTTGNANVAIGVNAMVNNTTGHDNTATGGATLASNTTGADNTAVGGEALANMTAGDGNTAIGRFAADFNQGNYNTATGFQALFNNTADNNVAYGAYALASNTDARFNTANGFQALMSTTTGGEANTAIGFQALMSNTTGFLNLAFGYQALLNNTTGGRNLAAGNAALVALTSGDSNTAVGPASLEDSGTVNFNTAVGRRALYRCQGDQNIGLGFFAGSNLNGSNNNIYIGNVGPVPIGTESHTIRIGTQTATIATTGGNPPAETHPMPAHTATFIAGIFGKTSSGGTPVYINSNGKLGTTTSSKRFKENIKPMDNASEAILALKPVTFRYKKELDPEGIRQFGLIAEQVEKVDPDLVARDTDGKVNTVRYDAVNAMLLNEFLKAHRKIEQQDRKAQEQQKEIDTLKTELREQKTLIQKVSAQLEVNRPSAQVTQNNE